MDEIELLKKELLSSRELILLLLDKSGGAVEISFTELERLDKKRIIRSTMDSMNRKWIIEIEKPK